MEPSELRRAVAAAISTASELRLTAEAALVLHDSNRVALRVVPCDILARVVAISLDPATTSVGDCMSTRLITADVGEPYEVCIERMQQNHVRHLIVLAQGHLAGILSLRDLLRVDLNEKSDEINLLNAYVHDRPMYNQ